mmetsp:Transcript_29568/g.67540  ORF Transcript_29568/g.67540 Transcript_29568/m.67540 type:complete len:151 (+) Transcript_29568:104-556(+)
MVLTVESRSEVDFEENKNEEDHRRLPLFWAVMNKRPLLALPPSTTYSVGPRLASDIVPEILSFCDATSLSRCSCVSKQWNELSSDDELWEVLCKERFGVSSDQLTPKPDPTRTLYILSHKRLRETLSCKRGVSGVSSATIHLRRFGLLRH